MNQFRSFIRSDKNIFKRKRQLKNFYCASLSCKRNSKTLSRDDRTKVIFEIIEQT